MNYIKKIGTYFLYTFGIILISVLFFSILNYFGIISVKTMNVIDIIILILGCFVGSFKLGINTSKKGYIEGLKYGLYLIIIFIMLNIIFFRTLNIKNIILYLIILISTTLGSMIGITKHKDNTLT